MKIMTVPSLFLMLVFGTCISSAMAKDSEPPGVPFANSCDAGVQAEFNEAVTLLHSFEYPETSKRFQKIFEQDPDCAMAYWGGAMSLWHPLWAPPSVSELEQGARLLAMTQSLEMTAREAAYIEALKSFFSSTDRNTHLERARAYEQKMKALYRQHLDDPEAAIFYALSILATADPKDKSYAHQYKAAALLNWVGQSQPLHPGVLHYTIHSYDFPELAHLGLDAALRYADAAPSSAHAQHMPSHIFTRLGMWERSLASNHDSTRSAAEYTERANLPGHYDEGLHSMDYLMYAMLQTARDAEAAVLLGRLGEITSSSPQNFKAAFTYASSPVRYALERRQWEEAQRLELKPDSFPWEQFSWARAINSFGRGIGAARGGDLDAARLVLVELQGFRDSLPADVLPYWKEQVHVQADIVQAWIWFGEGRTSDALDLMAEAAAREDAVDKHPVTPGEVLPARELFADMLLADDQAQRALEQYLLVLESAPNRLNAMVGAAQAAERLDQLDTAKAWYAKVRKQTMHGNRERQGVARAWN
jgi:tetratricopeptide (TPR) repeat protein